LISCYSCKHGDLDTFTEPCKSCLEKDTPPHWRFEPIGQENEAEKVNSQPAENITQLSIFELMQEDN
jgi:hypothetical protein